MTIASGCARDASRQTQSADAANYYMVTSGSAAFFQYGPQQVNGPDKKLPYGTLMEVERFSFGFARVRLTNGEQGYVGRTDIKPAPAAMVAQLNATPTPAATLKYAEPTLPAADATPAVEPTAIPAASSSPLR